jgi:tRNA modification GTPase
MSISETICAISTTIGRGAISVIRISGKDSFPIVSKIFKGKRSIREVQRNSIILGWIINPETEEFIDEVLVSVFKKPHSYTGEDLLEISTHGGIVIPKRVMNLLIKQGARIAEPGEFTRRAFLNNKMSLLEAEALLNVVNAKTERGAKLAEFNLNGKLQNEVNQLKDSLIDVKSVLEATLDFEDRENLEIDRDRVENKINKIKEKLKLILESYNAGRILIEGIAIAIVGKPNVGKSSLFNTILQEDKAIVTAEPGTTRDVLEGTVDIDGYPVKFLDMAGFRSPLNEPERLGIERARRIIDIADAILLLMDASSPLSDSDDKIYKLISEKPYILVLNKCELPKIVSRVPFPGDVVFVSAKEHTGINELNKALIKMIESILPDSFSESLVCTTLRQAEGIKKAIEYIDKGYRLIKEKGEFELVAFDFQEAIDKLKELTGEITEEDVLDRIFNEFCIGK